VNGLSYITKIAAGYNHNLALDYTPYVYTWGDNSSGQLGHGSIGGYSTSPSVISSLYNQGTEPFAIAGGGFHSVVLANDGTWTWGANNFGQLGNNSSVGSGTPVNIGIWGTGISAGGYHSLWISDPHTVKSWGGNGFGQLGDGSQTQQSTPVSVVGF
jgi:alpha-tubulin suppressor-like RCC1 family protein